MADKTFNKEVARFARNSKKECLVSLLDVIHDPKSREIIESRIADLVAQTGKNASGADKPPRKLSPYNRFVKQKLPEIAKESPNMDNKARMKHVSELWKNMSDEQKAAF
jgi:hypothetical protein